MLKVLQTACRNPRELHRSAELANNLIRGNFHRANALQGQSLCGQHFIVRHSSSQINMAKALVIVADGTEEMEAVSSSQHGDFHQLFTSIWHFTISNESYQLDTPICPRNRLSRPMSCVVARSQPRLPDWIRPTQSSVVVASNWCQTHLWQRQSKMNTTLSCCL